MDGRKDYVAPAIEVEGTLEELTLATKLTTHKPDGFIFMGITLTT